MSSGGSRMDVQSHSLQRMYPTDNRYCTGALPMSRPHVMACHAALVSLLWKRL